MIFIKKILSQFITVASLMVVFSCSNEEELANKSEFVNKVIVVCEDVAFEPGVQTKTSYASNLAFSWSLGDTLGIYPIGADQVAFPISSGEGSKSAAFDGGAWALRSTYQYAGYFPFSANNYHNSQTAIPFSYEGQSQNGSGTMTNLGKYDYMAAAATTPTATGNVSLQMKRLGCFMRLSLTVPEPCTLTKVSVESTGVKFGTAGTIDLTSSAPSLKVTKTSATMQTTLSNVTTRTSNENVIVWIQTAPVDLSAETLVVSATASNGDVFSGTVAGKKMSANGGYGYSVTLTKNGTGASGEDPDVDFDKDTTPYVTFHAESTQTLTMSKAVETLEYSVNGGEWTELGLNTVTFGGSNGDLRLRGMSSCGTAKSYYDFSSIQFGSNAKVECSGDIRSLVDFTNTAKADCSNTCFYNLFFRCTSLIKAPDLPTMNLASGCYRRMFYGCSSLIEAPELPATTLSDHCYQEMFSGCSSLIEAPELPATTLSDHCYSSMFYGCSSLIEAPELPATALAVDCYSGMFSGCSSLTEAPTLPIMNLTFGCYRRMFSYCSSLIEAPELPATTLSDHCYSSMFYGCSSLIEAPELPAKYLTDNCYSYMFYGCGSLTEAPELPARTLTSSCYEYMFYHCYNLAHIKMLASDLSADSCLKYWTEGVSPNGTFVVFANATWYLYSNNVIPEGWIVKSAMY